MYHAAFVGGGPAGLAPLVWAARRGTLRRLAARGLVLVEQGKAIGAGTIGHHAIGSDTLAETFLECLEDSAEPQLSLLREHPAAIAVAAHRGGSVPLPVAATFLEALGAAMADIIVSAGGRVLTNVEAVQSQRRAGGGWQTKLLAATGEKHLVSHYLVLATGGRQAREHLHLRPVAGRPLLPRFSEKLMLSGEILAHGGASEVSRRLARSGAPRVAIVGGSHSALAAANVLLNSCKVAFGQGAITVLHRQKLRVFYPSAASAVADGYDDFDANDICPVSHRLFRLGGFRLDARNLVLQALEIGGRAPEPRLRLCQIGASTAGAVVQDMLEEADLVIAALGYIPNALPLFDRDGNEILLAEPPAPLVDRRCRVLDLNNRTVPEVFGLGLAAGFVPSGALGGEPSFRGQTNGIWLWQNGVGEMIVDSLLGNMASPFDISIAAK
jgi:hypothetical protein